MTAPQPPAGGWQPIEHEQLGMAVVEAIADDGCRNAAGGIYATSVQEFAMEVQRAFAQQNGLHIRGLLPAPPAAAAEQSTDCAEQVKAPNASAAAHRSEAVATPVSAHSDAPPASPGVPMPEADAETAAMKRLLDKFNEEHGEFADVMRAVNGWTHTLERWNDSINRERETPTTQEDLRQAKAAMFEAVSAYAAAREAVAVQALRELVEALEYGNPDALNAAEASARAVLANANGGAK